MEPVRLSYNRGNLVLVGPYIDAIARASMLHIPVCFQSEGPFQVIVVTEYELRQAPKEFASESLCVVDQDSIIDLGVGCQDGVYFNAIFWKRGIKMRLDLGLPFKQLQIALSETHDRVSCESLESVLKALDLVEIFDGCERDHQVSLVVDYCKFLAQEMPLISAIGTEIVSVLRLVSSMSRCQNGEAALLDLLAVVLYKTKDIDGCIVASKELMSLFPKDPRGYFRCAGCYFHSGRASLREHHDAEYAAPAYCWKLAMILYAETVKHALATSDELQNHNQQHAACSFFDKLIQKACEAILDCAKHTEFGCLMRSCEAEAFPEEYLHLTAPWNPGVRNAVLHAFIARGEPDAPSQVLSLDSREKLCMYDNKSKQLQWLPRFFRWITPFRVAAMSTPKRSGEIRLLEKLGIGKVVTLTKEEELCSTWFATGSASHPRTVTNVYVPVTNQRAPTIAQMDYFFSLVYQSDCAANSAILVHCGGGKGRAGTFVACYLAKSGFTGIADKHPKYSATEVIQTLRYMRPGSVESDEQERFIASFVKELWRRAQTGGKLVLVPEPEPEEGSNDLQIEGTFNPKCKLLLCCGIPGSGKSTVSKALSRAGWTVASQDETGSRKGCAAVVSNAMRQNKPVIVDRCNPTIVDRREWIDAAMLSPKEASCLFFDYDQDLCLQRAKLRLDHPTLTSESQCTNAVRSMGKALKRPSMSEGFGAIVTINSIAAANKFVQYYSGIAKSAGLEASNSSSSSLLQGQVPEMRLPGLHKFPRTRHLFNFGSVTRDDLIMTKADAASFFNTSTVGEGEKVVITIEEKVDGANLGFSIDPETGNIRAQNRSHFITSKSHSQFKKLDFWIETHREDLLNLLCPQHCKEECNSEKAGAYILFGEWLQATHAIRYTRLPDYFLAFDLYDVAERKFWSRDRFWMAIRSTSIKAVPSIPLQEDMIYEESFKELMGRQSEFYDGSIEGVYLRRDRGPFLVDRGKVVRGDFISGNAYWSKQIVPDQNVVGSWKS